MAMDSLQEKIRKTKNPSVLNLDMGIGDVPPQILEATATAYSALGIYCKELLSAFQGVIPAVRFSFGGFALLGPDGLEQLQKLLRFAKENKFFVFLDAPEILSPAAAEYTAELLLGENSGFFCDAVVISGYLGSDVLKPFLPYCKKGKKSVFVVTRTGNKSAPELQDLLSGSRLVHAVVADQVNRYASGTVGKCGYAEIGLLAGASSAQSLRTLRAKYPQLFLLLDGYDYPNANAKNCSFAFDQFGYGAAVCGGSSIYAAWKQENANPQNYLEIATAEAERMKKNLTRYVSVL